jgi:putative 4-mercaptohistidine N1-methyltranferase
MSNEESSPTSNATAGAVGNVYENEANRNMYLNLHYPSSGQAEQVDPILPHAHMPTHGLRFPQRVAELLIQLQPKCWSSALDIGCAVGGSSFALAKSFDRVDAFDYSHSFIDMAKRMKAHEKVSFQIPIEADIHESVVAMHEPHITEEITSRANFFVGDACQLSQMKSQQLIQNGYDGVLLANLLCRLPDPQACLAALPGIVNPGGVVVMVTPFSWLEQFTPRQNWLGGYYKPNTTEPIKSKDELKRIMELAGFELIHEEQMPLIIREHQRKFQYIISEATGWRRKH